MPQVYTSIEGEVALGDRTVPDLVIALTLSVKIAPGSPEKLLKVTPIPRH
jgi:hypothetical protein